MLDTEEQDKCLECGVPVSDGGTWGYCSEECFEKALEGGVTC